MYKYIYICCTLLSSCKQINFETAKTQNKAAPTRQHSSFSGTKCLVLISSVMILHHWKKPATPHASPVGLWYLQVPWVISGFLPLKRHNHVHCSLAETLGMFNSLFLPGDIIWNHLVKSLSLLVKSLMVMTNSSPWKPWPIEIDDFPSYKPSFYKGFSMAMLNNQMVYSHYFLILLLVVFPWYIISIIYWSTAPKKLASRPSCESKPVCTAAGMAPAICRNIMGISGSWNGGTYHI